jgi:transcriptional regulator with XRE-family HTH domain
MKGIAITDETKTELLRLFSLGLTYKDIQQRTGVSPAAISEFLKERANQEPDLKLLHQIANFIKKKGITAEILLRGASLCDKIEAANSNLDEVVSVVLPFLNEAGDNAATYCREGRAYAELVKSTGKNLTELKIDYERLNQQKAMLEVKVAELNRELSALSESVGAKRSELYFLEELSIIKNSLERANKEPTEAAKTVEEFDKILNRGFSPSSLDTLRQALEKEGLRLDNAVGLVAQAINQYDTLTKGVSELKKDLHDKELEREELLRQLKALKTEVEFLKNDKQELTKNLRDTRKEYRDLNRSYVEREKMLQYRLKEMEEASRKRVEEYESKVMLLKAEAEKINREKEKKKSIIQASGILMQYIKGKRQMSYQQLAILYQQASGSFVLPLPDSVRRIFIASIGKMLDDDAQYRLEQASNELQSLMMKLLTVKKALDWADRVMKFRLAVIEKARAAGPMLDAITQELLRLPEYFTEIVQGAPDQYIVEALSQLPNSERKRLGRCLEQAEGVALEREKKEIYEGIKRKFENEVKNLYDNTFNEAQSFSSTLFPSKTQQIKNLPLNVSGVWHNQAIKGGIRKTGYGS